MYTGLLHTHSLLRYVLLALLIVVIVKALIGWLAKKPFSGIDHKLSIGLVITAHLQLLLGLWLYFISPVVQFEGGVMKNANLRYWTVEHISMMLIAIVLITVSRSLSKRAPTDLGKFKRLAVWNGIALLLIVVSIIQSGRGLL